mmetsp:Transcript_30449/g.116667  ORF Transcript_30449/g.116667 Transcript_30449/m.116667 type:complete len:119 (+) Transcript_30449:1663-2019(+)
MLNLHQFNGVRVDHGHVNGDWMGKLRMWLFFRTNTTARVTYIMGVFEFCLNDIVRRRNTFSSAAQFRVPFGTLGPLPPLMKPTIEVSSPKKSSSSQMRDCSLLTPSSAYQSPFVMVQP